MPRVPEISLSPSAFNRAFPFHLALSRDLRLLQVGPVLSRIAPALVPGELFDAHFRVVRPRIETTYAGLNSVPGAVVVLEMTGSHLRLQGQFEESGDGVILFLGTPMVNDLPGLTSLGLTLKDFPAHDSVADFLLVLQSNKTNLGDLERITTILRAERAELNGARARLQHLLTASPTVIYAGDQDAAANGFTFISDNAARLFHEEPATIGPRYFHDRVHPDDLPQFLACLHGGADDRTSSITYRLRSSDGEYRWRHDEVGALRDRRRHRRAGSLEIVGASQDVHDLMLANQARNRSEVRSHAMLTASLDAVVVSDRAGRILECSPSTLQVFGLTPVALVGQRLVDLVAEPEDRALLEPVLCGTDAAEPGGLGQRLRLRLRRASGEPLMAEVTMTSAEADGMVSYFTVVSDISMRHEAEEALRRSEHNYRMVVNTVKEVIFQTDATGLWTFLNPAWTEVTGFAVDESLGKLFLDYVHADDRQRNLDAFLPLLNKEKPYCRHEARYLTRDGNFRWIEVFARLTFNAEGETTGTSGTLNDVTDRRVAVDRLRESLEELRLAKEAADAANRAKTDFLAAMSHEIRTPLHAMLGMTDLMLGTSLTTEQEELMRSTKSSAELLRCLVSDLLDLSKIEARQMDLDPAPFDPWHLLEDVADLGAARAAGKGIDVICAVDPSVPSTLLGDSPRLKQILVNLVGNAVKFTMAGEVVLGARAEIHDSNTARFHVSVTDTGLGIPAADQPRIFERFHQAASTRRIGGSGLGLHITKSLVELMGGTITFVSEEGKGTRFDLMLPLSLVDARSPISKVPGQPSVLVADPSRTQRATLSLQLEAAGYAVDAAADQAEASACLHARPYTAVVADYQLLADGILSDLRALTSQRGGPAPRVVSLNLPGTTPLEGACIASPKPVRLMKVLAALRPEGAAPARTSSAIPSAGVAARRPAWVLVVEDFPASQVMEMRVLSSAGHVPALAEDGLAAVEAAARTRYDIILMDLQLPEIDGREAAARIRAAERRRGDDPVPIVALTAHAFEGFAEQCREAGMNDYVAKPVPAQRLLQVVDQWADRRPVILIADDSPDAQALNRRFLRDLADYRIVTARNGAEALEQLRRQPVDLALLDMQMPVLDGYATVEQIRATPAFAAMPVIAVSGDDTLDGRRRAERLGCTDYLVKPVTRAQLLASARRALESLSKQTDGVIQIPPDVADLVPGYVRSRRQDVQTMRDHTTAGELARVRSLGHNLKGTGSAYGLPDVTRIGGLIERAATEGDATALYTHIDELEAFLRRVPV